MTRATTATGRIDYRPMYERLSREAAIQRLRDRGEIVAAWRLQMNPDVSISETDAIPGRMRTFAGLLGEVRA